MRCWHRCTNADLQPERRLQNLWETGGRGILCFVDLLRIVVWLSESFYHHFQNGETGKESEEDKDANKSEISVVFEIALKRNIPVTFEVCVTFLSVLHTYLTKKVLKKGTTKTQHR